MKAMTLRISDELYGELVREAEATGIPVAVIARAYIKQGVEKTGTFSEIMGFASAVGRADEDHSRTDENQGLPPKMFEFENPPPAQFYGPEDDPWEK